MKFFKFTRDLFANNITTSTEICYSKLVYKRSCNNEVLCNIAVAACHTSGLWRVDLSARRQIASFLTLALHKVAEGSVVTRLRRGGICNDHFVANFRKSVSERI